MGSNVASKCRGDVKRLTIAVKSRMLEKSVEGDEGPEIEVATIKSQSPYLCSPVDGWQ